MKLPAWGLTAEIPATATAAFGARAILRDSVIDFVPDRLEWAGKDNPDMDILRDWMMRVGVSWLNEKAKNMWGNEDRLTSLDDDRCHLRANTCASYGYLYVAAWIEGEPI